MKMNILDDTSKRDCTGCSACSLVCHSSAISMHLTQNGFYQPSIDPDLCTMCSVCPDVCYKFNEFDELREFNELIRTSGLLLKFLRLSLRHFASAREKYFACRYFPFFT